MAADKLIDSGKLDACLEAEADTIRSKTGGSAALTFDFSGETGFSSALADLLKPTGTKSIIANGTVDVSAFATANVNVPTGPTTQIKTGSCTTGYNGSVTDSTIGFKPDLVVFHFGSFPLSGITYYSEMGFPLISQSTTSTKQVFETSFTPEDNVLSWNLAMYATTNGFTLNAIYVDMAGGNHALTGRTFNYTAYKWTE